MTPGTKVINIAGTKEVMHKAVKAKVRQTANTNFLNSAGIKEVMHTAGTVPHGGGQTHTAAAEKVMHIAGTKEVRQTAETKGRTRG
jgi:hypothetical protein